MLKQKEILIEEATRWLSCGKECTGQFRRYDMLFEVLVVENCELSCYNCLCCYWRLQLCLLGTNSGIVSNIQINTIQQTCTLIPSQWSNTFRLFFCLRNSWLMQGSYSTHILLIWISTGCKFQPSGALKLESTATRPRRSACVARATKWPMEELEPWWCDCTVCFLFWNWTDVARVVCPPVPWIWNVSQMLPATCVGYNQLFCAWETMRNVQYHLHKGHWTEGMVTLLKARYDEMARLWFDAAWSFAESDDIHTSILDTYVYLVDHTSIVTQMRFVYITHNFKTQAFSV